MALARWSGRLRSLVVAVLVLGITSIAPGDTVVMKNGASYRGERDKDNTIVWIFDGLKRVVVRDSKIARVEPDAAFRNLERFQLIQPLVVHGGTMPTHVIDVVTSPWNSRGRRSFSYVGSNAGKPVRMEQAINELGPHMVKIRGVDGFWLDGRLSTSQVPREVVLNLLAKVERTNQNERLRVARFLIQAEWYAEAKAELDSLLHDFPDLRESVNDARASVVQLEAAQLKAEIDVRRKAQQPKEVATRLRTFPTKDLSAELLGQVRDQIRADAAQAASARSLADSIRALATRLPTSAQAAWKKPLLEVVQALSEAPDAVRDRFDAWQKANSEPGVKAEARFALAMSGFVVGADAAVSNLEAAANYWSMRNQVREYLSSTEPEVRADLLERLQQVELPADPEQSIATKKLDTVTRLVVRMPPPLHDDAEVSVEPKIHRVRDDENRAPTDYAVLLPPEYHPLRSYPAVVALHGGEGPQSAISWWGVEASRRGYIVIAPEYNVPGEPREYRYTTSEHAAVELALRDARRRYSIDGDRVFVGGQLVGGHMAWDFGLAHPDLFAGVAVISGLPFKYVNRYLGHTERLPLYVALGDLAPASNEVVFAEVLKPLIAKAYDVTYVEYYRRGLEDLPEEAPNVFDWMDRRRREPCPKSFDAVSARVSDDRFYGVVIREFQPGRTMTPEAVDPFGKNLNPATIKMKSSSLSNLIRIDTSGIRSLDVWVSPKLIDFKKRCEVRINGKPQFKGVPKPDFEPMLEDLRLRGDRRQIYWLKVSAG